MLSRSLWKTGYGIVYQADSLLSALCRLHYSLGYVCETISVPCFLRCYLLVVSLEIGLGSGDLSSSLRGSLIKNSTSPSVPGDTGCKRQEKCQRISLQLSAHPVAAPGMDILYRGGDVLAKQKRQHTSLSFQTK